MEFVELERVADELDHAAAATPQIDRFCSSSAWILSAAEALMPARSPYTYRGASGFLVAMRATHEQGYPYLEPHEMMWGLGAPLVGPDPAALAAEVVDHLRGDSEWRHFVITGLAGDGPQVEALLEAIPDDWTLRRGKQRTTRYVASLAGGLDGFLQRRHRSMRKTLRKAMNAVEAAGITFEKPADQDVETLWARILDVETRSWKGLEGVGLTGEKARAFYAAMLPRLHARGRVRLIFARQDGRDVAYILGAAFVDTFRGLQFSFEERLSDLGLGNALQCQMIAALCEEGITRYDLGVTSDLWTPPSDSTYKERWAEETVVTDLLILRR